MENRFEKIASARKKLRDHQEKRKCPPTCESNTDSKELGETRSTSLSTTEVTEVLGSVTSPNNEIKQTENGINNNVEMSNSLIQTTAEMLIASKRNLETQMCSMQTEMSNLKRNYDQTVTDNLGLKRQVEILQNQISTMHENNSELGHQLRQKDIELNKIFTLNSRIVEENKALIEQLDFAKAAISSKDNETQSLNLQIKQMKSELDATQLHLNQLTTGNVAQVNDKTTEETLAKELNQKVMFLEEQIKNMQKEHSQVIAHYEHYMSDLNAQNKLMLTKNNELLLEIDEHSTREASLIDQIGSMEIRIQQLQQSKEQHSHMANEPISVIYQDDQENTELKQKYNSIQVELENMKTKVDVLQSNLLATTKEKEELEHKLNSENENRNISVSKLQDDITNDKVAAQLATEQNRKLKKDVQELEEAFVKMSKDKLRLTEMLEAEKYLNRELTLKLAEVDENAKDMAVKLNAKDNEMLRLQNCCREIERKYDELIAKMNSGENQSSNSDHSCVDITDNNTEIPTREATPPKEDLNDIRKDDAMSKLQERFMKIMNEVADLSDEKHRLEHIILQLQNETDTICEYIALYQQQRSVLKHREEERAAQLKLYRAECDKMKANLDELTKIVTQVSDNKITDSTKVVELIKSMKENCLVNPERQGELTNFHPCACCSGVLLDV